MSPTSEESNASLYSNESPFPDSMNSIAKEFELGETQVERTNSVYLTSPFPSVYELENEEGIDPKAEEYVEFLDELYDEEFDEALFELISKADELYQDRFESEYRDPIAQQLETERLLAQYFAPLAREAELMLETIAANVQKRELDAIYEPELESWTEKYHSGSSFVPEFEEFLGKLAKKAAKAVGKVAKKVGKAAVGPILEKLKVLVRPLLEKVLKFAINKLPTSLQPLAQQLAKQFVKEVEEEATDDTTEDISAIGREFDEQIANLVLTELEAERELAIAQYVNASQQPILHNPLNDLYRARTQFINQLNQLREGENPTPLVENFIPAILPALKLGISLVGRPKVVAFLAKFLAKLIERFIGPQYAPALSQAIVDAGLRLINLEATPEDEAKAAGAAVAATIEDTVRRVAALPEYVLDNESLLEGFALEAFEKSITANVPAVLSEKIYEIRPELRETTGIKGTWIGQPLRGKQHYKKYTRIFDIIITPHIARVVRTFCGIPLADFLRDRLGISTGRSIKARVHLYEAIPGTLLSQICKNEKRVLGLGTPSAWSFLHPLTPDAAGILLGQPGLGHEVPSKYLDHHPTTAVGQRLYYLEIADARPQVMQSPNGNIIKRHSSQVNLTLNFPQDRIQIYLFVSEAECQMIATKLRQRSPIGSVVVHLQAIFKAGLKNALSPEMNSHLSIIHGKVEPRVSRGRSLKWLPQVLQEKLNKDLNDWMGYSLGKHFPPLSQDFIKATEQHTDGVMSEVTLNNPPGFALLRKALRGDTVSQQDIKETGGMPDVTIQIVPGFAHR